MNNIPKHLEGYSAVLQEYASEHRLRSLPTDRTDSPTIDLVSNDYLGLGKRWQEFMPEFEATQGEASFSASASRLLARRQDYHAQLETLLGALYGKESLLFNSGYHANVGTIQALNIPGTLFLCDKLIHASMIDGLAASSATFKRWRHNDVASLRKLIERNPEAERLVVMVESIYSMDGDFAPLTELVELKREYPQIILYVDEAHAFGTRGNQGLGVTEELEIIPEVDIIVGTLGKAAASSGAFVVCDSLLKQILINRARSFIFSTAMPPANQLWSSIMIRTILSMTEERKNLEAISQQFRRGLEEIQPGSTGTERTSHIIPLLTGNAERAAEIATRLRAEGIDALPIRRPTVPPGGERIRFSLSADLSTSDIDHILNHIRKAIRE